MGSSRHAQALMLSRASLFGNKPGFTTKLHQCTLKTSSVHAHAEKLLSARRPCSPIPLSAQICRTKSCRVEYECAVHFDNSSVPRTYSLSLLKLSWMGSCLFFLDLPTTLPSERVLLRPMLGPLSFGAGDTHSSWPVSVRVTRLGLFWKLRGTPEAL